MIPTPRERCNHLRSIEDEKDALLEDLLKDHDRLQILEKSQERHNDIVEMYQERSKKAEITLKDLRMKLDAWNYVLVVIDGNRVKFQDHLVKDGKSGGSVAAQLLHKTVLNYMNSKPVNMGRSVHVVVLIYADIYNLMRTYRRSHLELEPEIIDRFVGGFNSSFPLINLIDAGETIIGVSSKIQETLKLHAHNEQCKHIFVGGPIDKDYTSLLTELVKDESINIPITLVDSPCDAPEANAQLPLEKMRFKDVFQRTTDGQADSHDAPATKPVSMQSNGGAKLAPLKSKVATAYPLEKFKDAPRTFVARNSKGQRVYVPLSEPPYDVVKGVRSRKICNDFVLNRICTTTACPHEHARDLSPTQIEALRHVARSFACVKGIYCMDESCTAGHRCQRDPCPYAGSRTCRFPPEMHEIDTQVVNDIDEYESSISKASAMTSAYQDRHPSEKGTAGLGTSNDAQLQHDDRFRSSTCLSSLAMPLKRKREYAA